MFEKGDIVHISHNWLDEGEDPNRDYFVIEDYGNGTVKVGCAHDGIVSYLAFVYDYEMVYKVGHIDEKELCMAY